MSAKRYRQDGYFLFQNPRPDLFNELNKALQQCDFMPLRPTFTEFCDPVEDVPKFMDENSSGIFYDYTQVGGSPIPNAYETTFLHFSEDEIKDFNRSNLPSYCLFIRLAADNSAFTLSIYYLVASNPKVLPALNKFTHLVQTQMQLKYGFIYGDITTDFLNVYRYFEGNENLAEKWKDWLIDLYKYDLWYEYPNVLFNEDPDMPFLYED